MENQLTLAGSFLAGVVSFLSPCVLPLVPAYLSFVAGMNLDQVQGASGQGRLQVLGSALLFVLGFSTIFILLGASATFFGRMLASHAILMMRLSGALLILMGLHVTGLLQIPFLLYEKRYQAGPRKGWISAFFVGAAFAFGWTPCVGPILAGILALAGTRETLGQGVALLAVYSLGLGLPFLLAALLMERFLAWTRRFKAWFRSLEVVAGLFLVFLGAVMMAGGMLRFASYLSLFNRFSI